MRSVLIHNGTHPAIEPTKAEVRISCAYQCREIDETHIGISTMPAGHERTLDFWYALEKVDGKVKATHICVDSLGHQGYWQYQIRQQGGDWFIRPMDDASQALNTMFQLSKTPTGYGMVLQNPDLSDRPATGLMIGHAMDLGIFFGELRDKARRFHHGGGELTPLRLTPRGDPVPYRLVIPGYLPQHIEDQICQRTKDNIKGMDFCDDLKDMGT